MENGGKRAVIVAHRRWGKDDLALHWTATQAVTRPATYWHMLPEASQARKAVWDAINPHTGMRRIDEAFPPAIREVTRENEMFIRFKSGASWQVIGSDNYNSVVGSPPLGIVFSEYSISDPAAWGYLRPILRENGGWAMFIYTPRGRNHGATMYEGAKDDPEWFCQKSTAEETGVFTREQLDQELREYQRDYGREDGEAKFRQEYLCDFNVAIMGAYWGRQMTEAEDEGRICEVIHDPQYAVDTYWDLGSRDATAVWFVQRAGPSGMHVIDYYAMNGGTLEEFAAMLDEKRRTLKYNYGRHIWPHDGGHKTLASGGRPLSSMFYDLGVKVEVQPRIDKLVSIQRVRQVLPRCWFDRGRCALGIEALRSYQKKYDDKNKVYSPHPMHNWASHGADAFQTFANTHQGPAGGFSQRRDRYTVLGRPKTSSWAA